MGDDRTLDEIGRAQDRQDREFREFRSEVREDFVRKDVWRSDRDADRARITHLENADTSEKASNRAWLLGLAQLVVGVVLGVVATYLNTRGGH